MIQLLMLLCLIAPIALGADKQNLPTLGDASSGIVSLPQERELGQDFLRALRAQAPTLDDPILQDYIEFLTYRLVANSQLQDRRLDLVLVRNGALNAFAVPGGVIGINHGLFFYGETENEISAILAHEIAHLSQRHFARGVEAGKVNAAINIAGLLASLVLVSTVGTDVGLAALSASQGAGLARQLAHSRGREAEADRVGINTLAKAEMDPRAMAHMFERLERASRYNADEMPDFLRTHPVTRSRISDAYNQTSNFPPKPYPLNIDFHLMKARVKAITAKVPADVIPAFRAGMNHEDPVIRDANAYGLVLALTENAEFDSAGRYLRELKENYPDKITLLIAEAKIHLRAERYEMAVETLEGALSISPNNYPLTMVYAEALTKFNRADEAKDLLMALASKRPNDEYVWYHLAEAAGLANDIPQVHWARAEYFTLNGNYDQALKQLEYGLPLVKRNFQLEAKMKQKMNELWESKTRK